MAQAGVRELSAWWTTLMLVCALSAFLGHASLAHATGDALAATQAFAAGAILTMLASTMMPEAYEEGGPVVGLATALGFLAAFVLDKL
jgi:ZIP family zinc transporter